MNITLTNFEDIYNKTYQTLLKYLVCKCRNLDDVNELIQDTYVELYHTLQRKRSIKLDDETAYLKGIAKNVLKKYYREHYKEIAHTNPTDLEPTDELDIEADFINKENVEQIWNYLNTKDILVHKIFYLYYSMGLKISEISEELEINPSTTKNYIYRTLKELKEVFGKEAQNYDK